MAKQLSRSGSRVALPAITLALLTSGWAPPPPEGPAELLCRCQVDLVQSASEGMPVFLGTATRVTFVEVEEAEGREAPIVVDFEVKQSWGQELPEQFTLHTRFNRVNCEGYWFEEGKTYLLYAHPHEARPADRPPLPWPPTDTYGTMHCGVFEGEEADARIRRLDQEVGGEPPGAARR